MFTQDLTTLGALVTPIAEVGGSVRMACGKVEHTLQSQKDRA